MNNKKIPDLEPIEEEFVFGRNVLLAFLEKAEEAKAGNTGIGQLEKIFLSQGLKPDKRIDKIKSLARQQAVPVMSCDKQQLDRLVGPEARHQGVVARLSQVNTLTLPEFLQSLSLERSNSKDAFPKQSNMLLVVVDGIQDPHNLGAIIRVAQAAGAKGLITGNRRSAGTTGTVAKASAGAIARLPIVKVKNLVSAIEDLKKQGFWIAGLDASGKTNCFSQDLRLPLVVVIGGEGDGLGRLVAEHCDFLLSIPMSAGTESLNAAVAAGIVFYEYVRQMQCEEK